MPRLQIAALTMLMLAFPAHAEDKDRKPADPNRKVCRQEAPIGSLVPKRTCHTAGEWQQLQRGSAENTKQILNQQGYGGSSR